MGPRPQMTISGIPFATTGGPRIRQKSAAAATALMLLIVAGCSSTNGSDQSASGGDGRGSTDMAQESMTPDAAVGDRAAVDPSSGDTTDVNTDLLDTGTVAAATTAAARDQVFTAALDIEAEVLKDSVADAGAAVKALGGFAANEDVDLGRRSTATITYRVPAEQFRATLDALAKVGTLKTQQVDAQDVTSQYADLEGRVTTLRTSIARLQGFLGEATDANQIASLEGELTRREAELESTEAQRRSLADQVDLSTITVSFTSPTVAAPVDDTRTLPTFLGGLEAGWDFVVGAGAIALTALGFILPFLVPVAALVLLVRWILGRRHTAAV